METCAGGGRRPVSVVLAPFFSARKTVMQTQHGMLVKQERKKKRELEKGTLHGVKNQIQKKNKRKKITPPKVVLGGG